MPDRMVRANILTSDAVNSLSWGAEVFYRRLMSVADDYGRYDARISILRTSLYSLKIDRVGEPDIVKWMGECSEAGLIRQYRVDSRDYLEILKFNQRLRAKTSKYPQPASGVRSDDSNVLTDDRRPPPEEKRRETKSKTEEKGDEAIFFPIEQCLVVAMKDERWVRANKATKPDLEEFNKLLEKRGTYSKNPLDYKEHFANWKLTGKKDDKTFESKSTAPPLQRL